MLKVIISLVIEIALIVCILIFVILNLRSKIMIYGIYVVRDAKSEFMTPTYDVNDESAIRNFAYAINNAHGIMGFAPNDFDLFKIGTFDAEKGLLDKSDFPVPEFIISGGSVFGVKDGNYE